MFTLANTSDLHRHVAETRQGRARWQNNDGQANHELIHTATLLPRRQDITCTVTLHAVTALQDMIMTRLEQHNMTPEDQPTHVKKEKIYVEN